jgi:hypothetical protein
MVVTATPIVAVRRDFLKQEVSPMYNGSSSGGAFFHGSAAHTERERKEEGERKGEGGTSKNVARNAKSIDFSCNVISGTT